MGGGGILESAEDQSGGWSVGVIWCLKLFPQFSSHLNETMTTTMYRWAWHIALRPSQRVPDLCPFFNIFGFLIISMYPYFLWQRWKDGLLIKISESSLYQNKAKPFVSIHILKLNPWTHVYLFSGPKLINLILILSIPLSI